MPTPEQVDQIESAFRAKYQGEGAALARFNQLGQAKLGSGAAGNLKLLATLWADGITKTRNRRKSTEGQEEVDQLVSEFTEFGTKAVLLTGAQRGGDFLNNQLRGQWAERVVLSMSIDQLRLVPFGPSGAAMPGEQDHRRVIMTYKEIQLLEGKRPDLLAFDEGIWSRLSGAEQRRIGEWPNRRLEPADDAIVRQARCGIEVKNSTWHYGKRRQVTRVPLSITVKEEERSHLTAWSNQTGVRLVFVQVLFDEIYCMSFARMEEALTRGHLYQSGDYVKDVCRKAEGRARTPKHTTSFISLTSATCAVWRHSLTSRSPSCSRYRTAMSSRISALSPRKQAASIRRSSPPKSLTSPLRHLHQLGGPDALDRPPLDRPSSLEFEDASTGLAIPCVLLFCVADRRLELAW